MSYPAVNSLIQTLELFQSTYPSLIHGRIAEMIDSLRASAEYFQNILEKSSHQKHEYERIKELEGQMRAAVQQAEDMLELNIAEIMREQYHHQDKKINGFSKWIIPKMRELRLHQKETKYRSKWTIQDETEILLRELPQAIDKIDAARKGLARVIESSSSAINASAYGMGSTVEDHSSRKGDSLSSKRGFTAIVQDTTVGLDDALTKIIDRLHGSASEREVITIWGMGGSGKTMLAKKAQHDPSMKSHFDVEAWVTISQEYHLREVLLNLVGSITGNKFQEMSDDQLMDKSYKALKGRRYLIVIDDVWSTNIWDVMARILPENNNGSRIILTTRLKNVAEYVNSDISPHEMMPLSSNESWKLLCHKVFGAEHNCPSEMVEIGKQIVEKCQGLPLAIWVVAGHLSRVTMTKESWATVAKNVNKFVTSNPNECVDVLAMSYHHLPIHLKPCFLPMGTFAEDHEIDAWRLVRLWVAEGILKSDKFRSLEQVAEDCLEDLASRNLIMVSRKKRNGQIKSCRMHDLMRDLSVSKAQNEKFLDVIGINRLTTFSAKNHDEIPRFSMHARISLEKISKSLQAVRSLYLFEEPHEPTGETSKFKALRVLTVIPRSYSIFHHRITLDSAILRYLEVMGDNHFTEFLPYMYNLQTFIFYQRKGHMPRHLNLRCIWNLKHLRHLRFGPKICLPNPQGISSTINMDSNNNLGLQHLQELSCLFVDSHTNEVLSFLTNLKKLSITYHMGRDIKEYTEKIGRILNLVCLNKLEVLECSFYEIKRPLQQLPLAGWCSFPVSLKKLTLCSGGFPWEDIATIAKLPNIEVPKLKEGAFRGEVWKLNEGDQFNQLKFLLFVDDTKIERWEASSVNFPNLRRLVLQRITKLEQIPLTFAEIYTLESIELYKCYNTELEKSAREIQKEAASVAGYDCLHVGVDDCLYCYAKRGFCFPQVL